MGCCRCCTTTGACCNGGACTEETCADCEDAGGVFQGVGTECSGAGSDECPCDPPADPSLCEKCVNGFTESYCPEERPNCCDGTCQAGPCGCCCVYEFDVELDAWVVASSSDTTEGNCTASEGQTASFKAGVSCADNPSPCEGDPDGTCCTEGGGCRTDVVGGSGCYPTGHPEDDGCYCDDQCYLYCYDCCGADARDCCTPKPDIASLWDDSAGPGPQQLGVDLLGACLAEYACGLEELWHAAMQSGAVVDGKYQTYGFARVSLLICLQEIESGVTPWVAQQSHRRRVTDTASAIRAAAT